MQGTIIAIEGTDGSGKHTQAKLLTDKLRTEGYDVETISFPQYDEPSSYFVREYLNGKYGSAEEVGPYTGSLFYALDRFAAAPKIRAAVQAGRVVILDRYVGSNMAHQGTKFYHAEERRGFFIWLDNLEFELLGCPRPSRSFVLRVPVEIAHELVSQKPKRSYTDKKHDLHEADTEHLRKALEVYDDMCQLFPKDFTPIDCTYQGSLLPIETVHELLWRQVEPYLPPKPTSKTTGLGEETKQVSPIASETVKDTQPTTAQSLEEPPRERKGANEASYFIPEILPKDIVSTYKAHLDRILALHADIVTQLITHLEATSITDEAAQAASRAKAIADAALPLATLVAHQDEQAMHALKTLFSSQNDKAARDLAIQYLSGQHGEQVSEQVTLVTSQPRNELDALPEMLYPHSSLPLHDLQSEIASWPYDKKANAFEMIAREHDGVIPGLSYEWDIVSKAGDFIAIASHVPAAVSHQACSPRYGYQVPGVLEDAGLSDQFEACFDISLGLYSLLQEAGFKTEAQYAVLAGHRLRWKLTLRSNAFTHLYRALHASSVADQLKASLAEAHPLLAETINK